MSDVFLALAQTEEGLGCFLVPRVLPDGTLNGMRLMRLKDKLGNRSNASSEIEYDEAVAWPVGEPGRGVRTIVEMVNMTRLDCVLGSAAGMRAGLRQALHHTAHRQAFGRELGRQPLMRSVLADLAVESEAATLLGMRLATAVDRSQAYDAGEAALRLLALAAGKYWVCKRGSTHAAEALECLGGNGYVEDSGMPRLYREAPLLSIWEGSGNVAALDVLRALGKEPAALDAFLAEVETAAGADHAAGRGGGRGPQDARRARRSGAGAADGAVAGGAAGVGAPGFVAGAVQPPGGRRRVLRLAARRGVGQCLRHPVEAGADLASILERARPATADAAGGVA